MSTSIHDVDYKNISLIKVGEYHNGTDFVPSVQIHYKNGDYLYGEFDKKFLQEAPFEGSDPISEHLDTDFSYDDNGAETTAEIIEVNRLIGFCHKLEFIKSDE